MTTPEFLRLLANISDQFDWTLAVDTGPRADRRRTPRFHLTAVPPSHPTVSLGPLEALCFTRTGRALADDASAEAAAMLDMDPEEARDIAAAANDRTWGGPAGHRAPVGHLLQIRRQLLEAVGIIPSSGNHVATG